jgi:hypothetical protein
MSPGIGCMSLLDSCVVRIFCVPAFPVGEGPAKPRGFCEGNKSRDPHALLCVLLYVWEFDTFWELPDFTTDMRDRWGEGRQPGTRADPRGPMLEEEEEEEEGKVFM